MLPTTILIDDAPRCVVRPVDMKDLARFLRNGRGYLLTGNPQGTMTVSYTHLFWPCPAEMPLEMMVERVLRPMWIILVPVSACCMLLVIATE